MNHRETYFVQPYLLQMKRFFFILFGLITFSVSGQTFTYPQPIAGFLISSDDLVSFNVIHGSSQKVNVSFEIDVTMSGQGMVLQMETSNHVISPGTNVFNRANVNIVKKRYLNQDVSAYESVSKSLPIGNYEYCIRIICRDESSVCEESLQYEQVQTRCEPFNIIGTTPLMLNTPKDEDVIKELRPNFTWIPPMPIGNAQEVTYSLTLVELISDQTGEEGIQKNRPLHKQEGIPSISLAFPSTLDDLKPGHKYAWRVEAFFNKLNIGTSEVWEFEIFKPEEPPKYIQLSKSANSSLYRFKSHEELYFVYKGEYSNDEFSISIFNTEVNKTIENVLIDVDLRESGSSTSEGLNTYVIRLAELNLDPANYTLELVNNKGIKYECKIKILE